MPRQTFSFRPQWMRKFDPGCETAFLSGGRGICIAFVWVCLDFLILFFVFCFLFFCFLAGLPGLRFSYLVCLDFISAQKGNFS